MKKYLLLAFVLTFSAPALSAEWSIGGFFSYVANFFTEIEIFLFEDVPNLFERAYAYLILWFTYMKLVVMLESIKFSMSVAQVIMADIGIVSAIQSAFDMLPHNIYAAASQLGIPRLLNIIFEAIVTRYVMRFSFIN